MYVIEIMSKLTEGNWKRIGLWPGDNPEKWFNKKVHKHLSIDRVVDGGEVIYLSDDKGGWQAPEFFRARKVEDCDTEEVSFEAGFKDAIEDGKAGRLKNVPHLKEEDYWRGYRKGSREWASRARGRKNEED